MVHKHCGSLYDFMKIIQLIEAAFQVCLFVTGAHGFPLVRFKYHSKSIKHF